METSSLPVMDCKIEAYAQGLWQGGIFIMPHLL
jgi:hypothetical protein